MYGFNRIGASIRFLVQHVLKGVLAVFYDDFPFLETAACSQLMETMVSRFLSLLGWKHVMKGDKGVPFQQVHSPGCRAEFVKAISGRILISNKPGRLDRMESLAQHAKGHYPPRRHDMQVIAGLLQYAVGNSLGATLGWLHNCVLQCLPAIIRRSDGIMRSFVTGFAINALI